MSDENDTFAAGSMDAIRAALAKVAPGPADSRTFKPVHVWQVVAAALPEIDRIIAANKGRGDAATSKAVYDDIAEELRLASGFDDISGESVRQYRSRLMRGEYDAKLAAIGFRRTENRIEATADLPEAENQDRSNAAAAIVKPPANLTQRAMPQPAVTHPQPDETSDDATPTRLR
jgi:hypothetical protein